jgi:hypothetical protein
VHHPSPPQPPVSALSSPTAFLNSRRPLCSKGAPRPLRSADTQGGRGRGLTWRARTLLTHLPAQLALALEPGARSGLLQAANCTQPPERATAPRRRAAAGFGGGCAAMTRASSPRPPPRGAYGAPGRTGTTLQARPAAPTPIRKVPRSHLDGRLLPGVTAQPCSPPHKRSAARR